MATETEKNVCIADFSKHSKQSSVFVDKTRFRVLVAGRRFGKTYLAINELIKNAFEFNESINWYIAPTYKQAKMIAWRMLTKTLPKQAISKTNETELSVFLTNGSEICLKGADNEDSLRGAGLSFVVLDEYSSMKRNVWEEIIRPCLTDTRGKALFIGTPKGKNHFWELWLKGQRLEDNYKSWQCRTIDNPFIDPDEIAEARKQLSERYFRQEYEASFEDYTGLIWPEFNSEHWIEPFMIPEFWRRITVIDPAISGTTAVLFGVVDEHECVYLYNELYEVNKRVSEIASLINSIQDDSEYYIDPASKIKNQSRQGEIYSLFDEYGDNGIFPSTAENDVEAGINRVAEYFKQGKIKVFNTLKNFRFEIERYHWVDDRESKTGFLKPVPYKHQDHLMDCLRYMIMSRPRSAEIPAPVILKGSVADFIRQDELEAQDWRGKYK